MLRNSTHVQLLAEVETFTNSTSGILIKARSPLNGVSADLTKVGKRISVSFEWDRFSPVGGQLSIGKIYSKIGFRSDGRDLILTGFFINHASMSANQEENKFLSILKAEPDSLYTKGYSRNTKYYYRLVIPLSHSLIYHHAIDTRVAEFANDRIRYYTIQNDKKKNFLVFESQLKQTFQAFSEKVFAVKNAIGYLTGYMAGDYGFFFAYTKKRMDTYKHFYRCEFRDSIKSSYSPVYSNPHGYIRTRGLAEKYYNQKLLRNVSHEEFSKLCQHLYQSVNFESAIVLIMESSVASLLFMPGGFAIALETLSDIIKSPQKQKLAPMTKPLSKQIRKECSHVIDKYRDGLSSDNYKALLDRISWLNQATNKAKLRAPFDFLGINLLDEDLAILQARNDFLHGRVPDMTNAGDDRSLERQNKDLYYASMRFYTMLNMLILKWIGFDNRVVNYPKLNEDYTGIKLKEDPYRQV